MLPFCEMPSTQADGLSTEVTTIDVARSVLLVRDFPIDDAGTIKKAICGMFLSTLRL